MGSGGANRATCFSPSVCRKLPARGIHLKTLLRTTLLTVCAVTVVLSGTALAQKGTDVTGEWNFTVTTDQGGGNPTFTFKQEGEKLTGKYTGTFGSADLTGTVKGNAIQFTFTADLQGQQAPIT